MSNKTPEEPAKKTVSAPKPGLVFGGRALFVGLIFLVILIIGAVSYIVADLGRPDCIPTPDSNNCLVLENVSTPEAITQGLSGRESLPEDHGMMFVFDEPGRRCFWMKDMKFAIDMIWIDQYKKVIDVRDNVSPETYPETFCPEWPAQYVLEVNAGVAQRADLSPGRQLQF